MITALGGFGLASRSAVGREPGVRDFLKLGARVETLGVFDGRSRGGPGGVVCVGCTGFVLAVILTCLCSSVVPRCKELFSQISANGTSYS